MVFVGGNDEHGVGQGVDLHARSGKAVDEVWALGSVTLGSAEALTLIVWQLDISQMSFSDMEVCLP